MTIAEWLKQAKKEIHPSDAELILCNVLKVAERSDLVLKEEIPISPEQQHAANELKERRKKGEPLAYVLGHKNFYGYNFSVCPDVLIPRPETENIIDLIKKEISCNSFEDELIICDVGTGSGCIATTVWLELVKDFSENELKVFGSDVSEKALKVAKENARNLGAKITFLKSNLLEAYPKELLRPQQIDFLVANLPYVDRDWDWLNHENLKYEPEQALFADKRGLAAILDLIVQAKKISPKYLILEADPSQHNEIISFAEKNDFYLITKNGFILVFIS